VSHTVRCVHAHRAFPHWLICECTQPPTPDCRMRHINRTLAGMVHAGVASEHAPASLAAGAAPGLLPSTGGGSPPGTTRASTASTSFRARGGGGGGGPGRSLTLLPFFLTALDEGDGDDDNDDDGGGSASLASSRFLARPGGGSGTALPPSLGPALTRLPAGTTTSGDAASSAASPPRRAADPVIHQQRAARRVRRRLAMIDAALAALHASIPGDDAGLSTRTRDTASILSGRSPSRVTVSSPGDGAGIGAGSPGRWQPRLTGSGPSSPGPASVWSLPTAATSSTRVSVTRRLTAADVAAEYRRARDQMQAQMAATRSVAGDVGGSDGGEGDGGVVTAGAAADWRRVLAPPSDIQRLVDELRRAGAADSLPTILAGSALAVGHDDGSDSDADLPSRRDAGVEESKSPQGAGAGAAGSGPGAVSLRWRPGGGH